MDNVFTLRLYLAGIAPDTQTMIVAFKQELTSKFGNNFSIEVVDVLEQPHVAEEARILATPTIVRVIPEPVKKVVLNLNNIDSISMSLNLIMTD